MTTSANDTDGVANTIWFDTQERRALARLDEELARKREPRGRNWAIVLAAGDGNRLRRLTTDGSGASIPKQFCSLRSGPSLLHEALLRAESLAPRRRICAVVAHQHERWWRESLSSLPAANVLVQPENRGTALGILFALLHILERDDLARVLVLPSDHHVSNEPALAAAMAQAVVRVRKEPSAIVLLGMPPEEPDPELGYIVPALGAADRFASVSRFVEKPSSTEARGLIARGALWNSLIVAAHGQALLGAIARHDPALVDAMRAAIRRSRAREPGALASLYPSLPTVDFSREVLEGREPLLRVLRVPACGWTDLGTVERVGKSLRASAPRPVLRAALEPRATLSLERQLAHFGGA
ncbi:MAG TPA: sugar phosphate nucleotidyltransferase [Gammaproteobacteria bacterium]|nr:sugar phosphate nucleotidyltransferase [Gammaproteobacteria bacterium]